MQNNTLMDNILVELNLPAKEASEKRSKESRNAWYTADDVYHNYGMPTAITKMNNNPPPVLSPEEIAAYKLTYEQLQEQWAKQATQVYKDQLVDQLAKIKEYKWGKYF